MHCQILPFVPSLLVPTQIRHVEKKRKTVTGSAKSVQLMGYVVCGGKA